MCVFNRYTDCTLYCTVYYIYSILYRIYTHMIAEMRFLILIYFSSNGRIFLGLESFLKNI